jgi:DNA-binding MarR family transcriptional regulator
MTPAKRTLVAVARAGSVRQTTIGKRMEIELMTLSTYLHRPEERGLVQRLADQIDRRAKLVIVTEDAQNCTGGDRQNKHGATL